MTPENKDKLALNVANSGKMLSVWFMGIVSALAAGYASLPAVCDPSTVGCFSQAQLLDYVRELGVPAPAIAFIVFAIGYYLRVVPQESITPEVAEAKSAEAGDTISELERPR